DQNPFDNREREAAVLDQVIVELAEAKIWTGFVAITPEQIHDLPFAHDVTDLLRRTRSRAGRFAFGRLVIQPARFHEILHGLLEGPLARVQIHVHSDPRRAIPREPQHLSLRRRVLRVKAGAHEHLLAVKRPAFDEATVAVLAADFVAELIRDRELHEMAGNSFMAEDRARVFDRGTDIEIFRLGVVSRNEIKAGRIFVVNAGGIHETAGTGRLEGFGQLPNLEAAQII